jgi:tRNA A-37 threonylcarbamoyl transferase component Bud32
VNEEAKEHANPAPRVRSPADILRLVVAAVVLLLVSLVEWLFGETIVTFVSELLAGLEAIPDWILTVIVVGTRVLTIAVLVGGLLWTAIRDRWGATLSMVVAGAISTLLLALIGDLAGIEPGAVVVTTNTDLAGLTSGWFPSAAGIGILAATLTAGAPWLNRSWRRVGWAAVIGLMIVRTLTSAASFDSLQAVVVGWLAGAAALVALGAPARRATADTIAAGMAGVGLPLAEIHPASVDARGSTPYFATTESGDQLFVKVLGQDERSADLLFRIYRRIQRHDLGDERAFSSLRRAVEHEAFLALAARDLGIRTPRFRALVSAEPNSFVLSYDTVEGRSLDRVEPDELTDDILLAIWQAIADLRSHGIAHRDLRLANVFLGVDGEVWMIDFGFSELAASELLLANDVAELVASSSVYVGAERAVAPALATVDDATRARAVERLQPWALSGATRTAMKERAGLLDELRDRLAALP